MHPKTLHRLQRFINLLLISAMLALALFPTGRVSARPLPVPQQGSPGTAGSAWQAVGQQAESLWAAGWGRLRLVLRVLQRQAAPIGVTPTPQWVNFFGLRARVDGQPAPLGSVVRAYTSQGVLAGETLVNEAGRYGLLAVYADDPDTPQVEGLLPGEAVSFTIDDRPAAAFGPSAALWTENGDLLQVDLAVGEDLGESYRLFAPAVSQQSPAAHSSAPEQSADQPGGMVLPLRAGWNLVSLPYQLESDDPALALASIGGLFSVVLGYDQGGLSYYPNLPPSMNTLQHLDPARGYWIKMALPGTLVINGERLADDHPIALLPGWNLLGYLPRGPRPVASALAPIDGKYSVVLGYDNGALSYYPGLPPEMNSLQELNIHHGYWVRMTEGASLTFPSAQATATPWPTATSSFGLPGTPTPLPTLPPTPTVQPVQNIVNPPATIISNTTWSPTDGVYLVNQVVSVNQGVTLTILPGTVVKFASETALAVNGSLVANGTAASPIVFTSQSDDSYGGDTNSDGQMTLPSPGQWGGVLLTSTAASSSITQARFQYAGGQFYYTNTYYSGSTLYLFGCSPLVENIHVQWGSGRGIWVNNSAAPTIRSAAVRYMSGDGILIENSSAPVLENNTLERNNGAAIRMASNTAPRFSGNHASSNSLNGVVVNGIIAPSVTWDADLPYVLDADVTVNPGITLTLKPGVILKFYGPGYWSRANLVVNGTLNAVGTAAQPIILTSLYDDSVGGDTNNDGPITNPGRGDWGSLVFARTSTGSLLEQGIVQYGGGNSSYQAMVTIDGSAPTLRASLIRYSARNALTLLNSAMPLLEGSQVTANSGSGLVMQSSSCPTLNDNGFRDNRDFAAYMDGSACFSGAGNVPDGNGFNGIGVSGIIPSSTTTWLAGMPYIVDGGITVNTGATLVLMPGVVVKFRSGDFVVNGTLRANGTAGSPILFTALQDPSMQPPVLTPQGGAQPGLAAVPDPLLASGLWGQVRFNSTSSASTFDYVVVRYGGLNQWPYYDSASIKIDGASPSFNHTVVMRSGGSGINVSGGSPSIANSVLVNNQYGLYADTYAAPVLTNTSISGNTQYGVYNATSGTTLSASLNWWGHPSGPRHASNPQGLGDAVSDGVDFSNWLAAAPFASPPEPQDPPVPPAPTYVSGTISTPTTWTLANSPYVVNGSITVNNGITLTIQPGVVVKFEPGCSITVNGILAASGTNQDWIIFTSLYDDSYAGDTNGDQNQSYPSPGNWSGILINASASSSALAYTLLQYASTALSVNGASPSISYSTLRYNQKGLAVSGSGAPLVQYNTFRENTGDAVTLSGSSPTLLGNVFVKNTGGAVRMDGSSLPNNSASQAFYNGYNGILVSGSASTIGSWHKDLVYVIDGGLTVETGVRLTLEPGIIVKFKSGSLAVNGGLIANGSAGERIIFTSIHDDSAGGDTNNNGAQTWPTHGSGGSLSFSASSLAVSSLTYCNFTYGAVSLTGASPTIAYNTFSYASGSALTANQLSLPAIHDNVFENNLGYGLVLSGSSGPVVQNNTFRGNLAGAVSMEASSTPTFINNTAVNNRINGVRVWGEATSTATWKADLTYVNGGISIASGVTLTFEPGLVMKMETGSSIYAYGNMKIIGTSSQPITFTSIHDDSIGGDTNNNGSAVLPAAGDWNVIHFASSSTASQVSYALFRYGGASCYDWYCGYRPALMMDGVSFSITYTTVRDNLSEGLAVRNASPTIDHSQILQSGRYGIYLVTANPIITNNTIQDNAGGGIVGSESNPTITGNTINHNQTGVSLSASAAPFPSISGNTFANNNTAAASIDAAALPTFGLNTFTGEIGNGIWVGNGTLTTNAVLYGSGVYVLSSLVVEQGVTLTVQPGAVVKMQSYLDVKGNISATGSASAPIIFTSLYDDAAGGDTNNDQQATSPGPGNWYSVYLGPTSGTSSFVYTTMRYAGGSYWYCTPYCTGASLSLDNSSPEVRHATFEFNANYGIWMSGSHPVIDNSTFANQGSAVYILSLSTPTLTNSTISGSGTGVYLDDSSTAVLTGNTFLSNSPAIDLPASALHQVGQNTAASRTANAVNVRSGEVTANAVLYDSITYVFNQVTVNAGVVLTARPGAVVKFSPSGYWGGHLLMRGKLEALGTASQKITFTSYYDLSVGGDTANQGQNKTDPAPGNWRGIFLSTSDSNLDHVILRYGGASMTVDSIGYAAGLVLRGVSPTISNSEIGRNSGQGIYIYNASPSIHHNRIWGNQYGIITESGARPSIHHNQIEDNSAYGVYNSDTSLVVDATDNAWGHDSGPAPVGAGNAVNYSDRYDSEGHLVRDFWVSFDPWNGKTHWIETNLGVLKQWVAYVAEPVNTATGNYVYQYLDLSIPGRGPALAFERFYNTLSTYNGPLGYGWTFNYGLTASETTEGVLIMREDGRLDKFTPDGAGGYTPPKGLYDTLTREGGVFVLTTKERLRYTFNSTGKLASIRDRNGNTLTLNYTSGRLSSAVDAAGRSLSFAYDGSNRITSVTDPGGRVTGYGYDEFSNLISITDARGGVVRIAYDSLHRLITITDQNDHIFVTNIYDDQGRVVIQRDARLKNTTFSYDVYSRTTTVTDPLGRATSYYYDSELRLVRERDTSGYSLYYEYDASSNRTKATNKRGQFTTFEYDSRGNLLQINAPLSSVTSMTYDSQDNLLTRTDPLGFTTTNTFDASGNLLTTTDPEGGSLAYTYDANGLMLTFTDPLGHTSSFGYNSYGLRMSVTDPLGQVSTTVYDVMGRKLSETDALGRVTSYTYDAANHILSVTAPGGGVTTYTYDAVGNQLTATDPLGNLTSYLYDQKDKLIRVTDALGGETIYGYDDVDNKILETNPLGRTTNYAYDGLHRLVSITDPLNHVTRFYYDVDGNRTGVDDPNGKRTNYTVDALNRVTQVTDPLLNVTTTVYDLNGNPLRVIDPMNAAVDYTYDRANRLVSVTDALGGVVTYTYDAAGNRTAVTDANGHVTSYSYDALNRLQSVTDALGHSVAYTYDAAGNRTRVTNARGQAVDYTYDADNRLLSVVQPGGWSASYSYDLNGRRTAMTDPTGSAAYTYDALGRLVSAAYPGGQVVGYAYDAAGSRTALTYPDGKQVTYTYDTANRLTKISDWLARETTFSYDNAGRVTTVSNPNYTTTTFAYDSAGRVTGIIHSVTSSGAFASFSYTLDRNGNRTRVTDTEGITSYQYDALNRLTLATYPDATSESFTYDAMGNRTALNSTTEGSVTYSYDAADRLVQIAATTIDGTTTTPLTWDADGNLLSQGDTTFTWDAANRLLSVSSPGQTSAYSYSGDNRRASQTVNGVTTSYIYDLVGGLATVLSETSGADTTLYTYGLDLVASTGPAGQQTYYHTDALGSTRALTDGTGALAGTYTYTAFGKVRSQAGAASTTFQFTGEQVDPSGLVYLRARYYDPLTGRFISKDPMLGTAGDPQSINRYPYARNNPALLVDPSGNFFWAAVGIGLLVAGVIGAANMIGEGINSWQNMMTIRYQEYPAMIENPNATTEDFENLDRRFLNETRNFTTKTSQGLIAMPGTSLAPPITGPSGFASTWWEAGLDFISGQIDNILRVEPIQRVQEIFFDRTLRQESRAGQVLGLNSFGSWSRQSGGQFSRRSYENYLSQSPLGRVAMQASRGTSTISQVDLQDAYVPLMRVLQSAGYNPARPSPPPGGGK